MGLNPYGKTFRQRKKDFFCALAKEVPDKIHPQKNPGIQPGFIIHECISKSPSPSLAGQTVIADQAVLLAPVHHAWLRLPRNTYFQ